MANNYNENAIKEAAYYIWQNAGCPSGMETQHWAMAIEQLNNCKCSSKSCSSSKKCSTSASTTSKKTSSKTASASKTSSSSKKTSK